MSGSGHKSTDGAHRNSGNYKDSMSAMTKDERASVHKSAKTKTADVLETGSSHATSAENLHAAGVRSSHERMVATRGGSSLAFTNTNFNRDSTPGKSMHVSTPRSSRDVVGAGRGQKPVTTADAYAIKTPPELSQIAGAAGPTLKTPQKMDIDQEKVKDGQTICFEVQFNINDISEKSVIEKSSTVEEYMRWKYIMQSPNCFYQLIMILETQLPVEIEWRLNEHLFILSKLADKQHLDHVCNEVVRLALGLDGFFVYSFPILQENIKLCRRKIETSAFAIMNTICCENFGDQMFVVYLKKNKQTIGEFVVNVSQMRCKLFEVAAEWHELLCLLDFDKLLKGNLKETQLEVEIVQKSDKFACRLFGPVADVKQAWQKLNQISKSVKHNTCQIMIPHEHKQALYELQVEHELNEQLKSKDLICIAEQFKDTIIVYGIDDENVRKGCILVGNMLVERTCYLFNEARSKSDNIIKEIATNFKGKVVVHPVVNNKKLFIIGLKEYVEKALELAKNLTKDEKSKNEDDEANASETFSYEIKDDDNYDYFCHSKFFEKETRQINVTFSCVTEDGEKILKFSGEKDAVDKCKKLIAKTQGNLVSKHIQSVNLKTCKFFSDAHGKAWLKECALQKDLSINQKIGFCQISGKIKLNDEISFKQDGTCLQKMTWLTDQGKHLYLVTKGNDALVEMTTKILDVKFQQQIKGEKNKKFIQTTIGYQVLVRVPSWVDGETEVMPQFKGILNDILERIENRDETYTAIFTIDLPQNWPVSNFMECIISTTVANLLVKNNICTKAICIVVGDDDDILGVARELQKEFKKCLKGRKFEICVSEGELNKAEVDAVVNTTSKSLDLSHGRVSSSLLKAAGQEMQMECRKNYPNGLSNVEIAVTRGYRLPCKNVFHIALEKYDPMKKDERVDSIRHSVYTCLAKASELELKEIAFPALGTGNLQYPNELAAMAMFEGVEMFRKENPDTSLKKVKFVIYYTDKPTLEVFNQQKDVIDSPEDPHKTVTKTTSSIEVKIFGVSENVYKVEEILSNKFEELSHVPDDVVSLDFQNITRSKFLILEKIYKSDMEKLCNIGVKVIQLNDCVRITGSRSVMKDATQIINGIVKIFDTQWSIYEVSAKNYDSQIINQEIDRLKSKKSVICVHDTVYGNVYICGQTKKDLKKVGKRMQDNIENEYQKKHKEIKSSKSVAQSPEQTVSASSSQEASQLNKLNQNDAKDAELAKGNSGKPLLGKAHENIFQAVGPATKRYVYKTNHFVVYVCHSDILQTQVDCIVNPVSGKLGIDNFTNAVVHFDEIPDLKQFAEKRKKIKDGPLHAASVKPTKGTSHNCVLHTICPSWDEYKPMTRSQYEACMADLKSAVVSCYVEAEQFKVKSIALPLDRFELFGIPRELCVIQHAESVLEFDEKSKCLQEIHFVASNDAIVQCADRYFTEMIMKKQTPHFDEAAFVTSLNDLKVDSNKIGKNTCRSKQEKKVIPLSQQEVSQVSREPYCEEVNGKLLCTFSKRFQVHVFDADIMNLNGVNAVVCSVDQIGKPLDNISQVLLTSGDAKYKTDREKQFATKRECGEIVVTPGGKTNFKFVFHVVVTCKDPDVLHKMYKNIFDKALNLPEVESIASALLCIGNDSVSVEQSASIIFTEWTTFCKRYDVMGRSVRLYVVLKDRKSSDGVKVIFKGLIDGTLGKLQEKPDDGTVGGSDLLGKTKSREVEKDVKSDKKEHETSAEKVIDDCVICMDRVTNKEVLKCGHVFCKECIEGYFRVKMACPTCGMVCGVINGDQPDGTMEVFKSDHRLEGYASCHTIGITYRFEDGTQWPEHPRPGTPYKGIQRTAYLPDNQEGREICALLAVAFERRLVFTIGTSRTTGKEGVITWNDIHHKTNPKPNTQFGYPDATYLQRVREELEAKGVKKDDVNDKLLNELKDPYFLRIIRSDSRV